MLIVVLHSDCMLFFGWLLGRTEKKSIAFGYQGSMRNEEAWKFANQYFGKYMVSLRTTFSTSPWLPWPFVFWKGNGDNGAVGCIDDSERQSLVGDDSDRDCIENLWKREKEINEEYIHTLEEKQQIFYISW